MKIFLVGSTLIHRELKSNYANLFLKDFKYLTAMNAAKQSNINPTSGSWKWDQIDNFVQFSNMIINYFLDFIVL